MILFRRMGSAFRGIEEREWALLTLETLGVVAGILIAFELNEWASQRNEAAKHQQLMERLFEESQLDVVLLRDMRDGLRDQVKNEVDFATRLSSGVCPPEQLWLATGTVNRYPAFRAPRSVYQELMGAGGLSSIEHERVRFAIAQFNGDFDWSVNQNEFFRMSRHETVSDDDPRAHFRYDASSDDLVIKTFDREELCGDQAFRNRMISAARNHYVMLTYHEEVTDDAIYMCGVLGQSLGKTCEPPRGGKLVGDDLKTLREAIAAEQKSND